MKSGRLKLNIDIVFKIKEIMLILVLLLGFFIFKDGVFAENSKDPDLIITEIMYDPEGSDDKKEWIEVFNKGKKEIDLEEWVLIESSEEDVKHKIKKEKGDSEIKPGEYAIIAQDAENFLKLDEYKNFNGTIFDSSFSLSNEEEEIILKKVKKS